MSDFFINLFKLYFFFFYWGEVGLYPVYDLEVYVPNSSDANYHTTSASKVPEEPSLKLAVMNQVSFIIKKITWFEIKRFIFRFLLYHLLSLWFWMSQISESQESHLTNENNSKSQNYCADKWELMKLFLMNYIVLYNC